MTALSPCTSIPAMLLYLVRFVPIATTVVGILFAAELWRHCRRKPNATYLQWWFIGVLTYVAGTTAESLTAIMGWHPLVFRAWYITGALLGAAPLAQGTVYLLMPRRIATALAVALLSVVAVASLFVLQSPLDPTHPSIADGRLTGAVLEWQWVRRFSPFLNAYAALFLVGGAIWSAVRYRRVPGGSPRVRGNALIAVGTLLPGIGGAATRMGYTEVLYVTELVGLLLVWRGYHGIAHSATTSVHAAQRSAATIPASPMPTV